MSNRRHFAYSGACAALALCISAGCAEDLAVETTDDANSQGVVTQPSDSGSFMTRVDASAMEGWRYFSFASSGEVAVTDPLSSPDWDLAFQRFHILSNGGVTGGAGAAIATLTGQAFADVSAAPADGYVEDQPDGDDDDSIAESAFSTGDGWYDYDPATNRLSPFPNVYVVRTGSGALFKLAILDYYDEAGTSGHPMFEWAGL